MPTPDEDDNDTTPKGLLRRLNKTVDLLERANARLTRIKGVIADPPEPDHVAALNQVKSQASRAATLADEMLRR